MSSNRQLSTRSLLQQLRNLGNIRAPDSLLPAILARIELEDVAVVEAQTMERITKRAISEGTEHNYGVVEAQTMERITKRSERRELFSSVSESLQTEYGSSSHELALDTMSLSALEDRCMSQIERYRRNEPHNDQECLEVFYRAMVKHDPDAWELLQRLFTPTVREWMCHKPYRDVACRHEPEENYVNDAFARVWQASMCNRLEFTTLEAALDYLKISLQGALIDKLLAYSRPREVPLPDPGSDTYGVEEPATEDEYGSYELWEIVKSLLPNKRERRLAYLMYVGGLKPREIIHLCANEFSDIQEVYRLHRNIIERLMSNSDQMRWRLDGEES